MVNTKIFGKPSSTEIQDFKAVADACGFLISKLKQMNGIIDKDQYITKITQAISHIDTISALKSDLEEDRTTLQNA